MAKTTAPLLSFDAGGKIANTQVYSRWRGIPYVRRYVVPANPNTSGQQETRSIFSWCSNTWKNAGSLLQAPWTAYALGQKFYNRNAWIGKNTAALRPGTDLTAVIGSPGAKGGVAPTSITATGAAGSISVAFAVPTPPTGWTIQSSVAVAFPAGDPHTATDFSTFEADATTSPWTVDITGLDAGDYEISGWLVWTKPDATLAYSTSLNATATAT